MTLRLTDKQKAAIRAHYSHLLLQFRSNGSVVAKPRDRSNSAWGVLYTPGQTKQHLEATHADA